MLIRNAGNASFGPISHRAAADLSALLPGPGGATMHANTLGLKFAAPYIASLNFR
jgi:hypothetical protein